MKETRPSMHNSDILLAEPTIVLESSVHCVCVCVCACACACVWADPDPENGSAQFPKTDTTAGLLVINISTHIRARALTRTHARTHARTHTHTHRWPVVIGAS